MSCKHSKIYYRRNIQVCAIFVLSLIILFFHILPKKFISKTLQPPPVVLALEIENIPVTKQLVRSGKPRPVKPVIPIPAEEEIVPQDVTIEFENVNLSAFEFGVPGFAAAADTIPPILLVQSVPEYPEKLRKLNIRGTVRLLLLINEKGKVINVVPSQNSTQNELCEKAAIEAAFKNKYRPAKSGDEKVSVWTFCEYSFSPD